MSNVGYILLSAMKVLTPKLLKAFLFFTCSMQCLQEIWFFFHNLVNFMMRWHDILSPHMHDAFAEHVRVCIEKYGLLYRKTHTAG